MSLVGFQAKNHPQQVASEDVDDRSITDADFVPLHERFRFTIDAAAAPHNAKLPRYWTRENDALSQSWAGERVWCNPPYSDIQTWVEKAWRAHLGEGQGVIRHAYCDCRKCNRRPRCPLIVMLLPANRTEQGWWQDLIEPARRTGDLQVEFLRGRMRFDRPNAVIGPKGDRPPFGCCLVIWASAA